MHSVDTNLHATTGCETIRAGCSDAKRKKKGRERKRNTRKVERKPWAQRKVAVVRRWGCNMTRCFRGVKHVYCAKFMLTVSSNDNPITNNMSR